MYTYLPIAKETINPAKYKCPWDTGMDDDDGLIG